MDPYLGQIWMVAFNFAPIGFLLCDGSLYPIAQYEALYALIGTTYGGDGVSTFAVPDLRGRAPVHHGQGPGLSPIVLGQAAGVEQRTLVLGNLPAHTHPGPIAATSVPATTRAPGGALLAGDGAYATGATVPVASATSGAAGGNQPVDLMQPYLAINFVICAEGIFPSQA